MKAERSELVLPFGLAEGQALLLGWYDQRRRSLPWRERFATSGDPYVVWVSEIMLQQTVIKAVIPVYERFLKAFPTVEALAAADESAVREAVRGLGYYRRFRFLHTAAKEIVRRAAGGPIPWPRDAAGWRDLPGIGDYTSAAVSSIAFGYPAFVVDGNVERVFCRLLDIREAPNQPRLKKLFKRLGDDWLPARKPTRAGDFNQAVMELGQTTCTPTSPLCDACPLERFCLARQRGSQQLAPAPKPKPEMVDVRLRLTIIRDDDRVLLVDRPPTSRFLKGTEGFPTDYDLGEPADVIGQIKHGITRHKITAEVAVGKKPRKLPPGARWVPRDAVETSLVSNLDRKAWKLAEDMFSN